jgi:hypothetical protein
MSAYDPRTFLVKPCGKSRKTATGKDANKRDFFSAIGKVGDLEVLNDIGAGAIGEGMRVLSKVSNSIRTGRSVVPGREQTELFNNTLSKISSMDAGNTTGGANVVMDTMGLGRAVDAVGAFNPGAANQAYGQAKQIYEKVKQGNFEVSDIPEYVSDFQNLDTLFRGIYTPPPSSSSRDIEMCGASPFAMDLIRFAPKNKFMFIVQITFTEPYQSWSNIGNDVAFIVKTSTRPNINFEYEEVNMYNFRTRVPKRTVYEPMKMTFYDDNQNNANLFYIAYTRAMSPIANLGGMRDPIPTVEQYQDLSMDWEVENGMTFDRSSTTTRGAASLGALIDDTKNVLAEIKLYHIFEYGRLMNVYRFFHPKITAFELDELTMLESGAGSEVGFSFEYDGLHVIPNYAITDTTTYNIEDLTNQGDGLYPIKPNFGGVTSVAGTDNAQSAQLMTPQGAEVTVGDIVPESSLELEEINVTAQRIVIPAQQQIQPPFTSISSQVPAPFTSISSLPPTPPVAR